ncbi:MAG: 2-amino-4-hydroxy-6-hydroxymethyldihydropteridine diphosphokinase [Bacteroidia bacterium]|nr:2-amino-4-hydroxy-6-hydroxymethyldihydropteridine diphosphokinase [Bacteroidia bacterium]
MARVFLGLGSNLGDRLAHLAAARQGLEADGVMWLRASGIYETEPWGFTNQPEFANQVVEVALPEALGSPEALLQVLQRVEFAVGRTPTHHWGPRVLDIDLLAFGELSVATPTLTLPHPGIPQRAFVLVPWAEIAPEFVHPTWGTPIAGLLAALPTPARAGVRWLCGPVGATE